MRLQKALDLHNQRHGENQWISVKDHLPRDCEPILVYVPCLKAITCAYLMYHTDNTPICYAIIDLDEYEQDIKLDEVSHWMRLPSSLISSSDRDWETWNVN